MDARTHEHRCALRAEPSRFIPGKRVFDAAPGTRLLEGVGEELRDGQGSDQAKPVPLRVESGHAARSGDDSGLPASGGYGVLGATVSDRNGPAFRSGTERCAETRRNVDKEEVASLGDAVSCVVIMD